MAQTRQARTVKVQPRTAADDSAQAPQDVAIRLSRWSVELPDLAKFLADNQSKYTREEHSTQYLVFHCSRAFGQELGRFAVAQQQRYQKLAKETKDNRRANQRSADVYGSVLKRITRHMAAPAPEAVAA